MSWNGTCGITRLPIFHNDDVVCFILIANRFITKFHGGGYTEESKQFSPVSLPIFGKYDDFGAITDIIDKDNIVFNQISEILENVNYNESMVTPKNIEDLIRGIVRKKFNNVAFMLVHRDIYNSILDDINTRKGFNKEITLREEMVKSMCSFYEMREIYEESPDKMLDIRNSPEYEFNPFNRITSNNLYHYQNKDILKPNTKVILIDLLMFIKAMELARILWIPQVGAGSQDDEYNIHTIIAKFIIEKEQEYRSH